MEDSAFTTARTWALPAAEVAGALGVDPSAGISMEGAAQRLAAVGPNRLREGRRASVWRILGRQFESLTALLLAAAAAAAFIFGGSVAEVLKGAGRSQAQ